MIYISRFQHPTNAWWLIARYDDAHFQLDIEPLESLEDFSAIHQTFANNELSLTERAFASDKLKEAMSWSILHSRKFRRKEEAEVYLQHITGNSSVHFMFKTQD